MRLLVLIASGCATSTAEVAPSWVISGRDASLEPARWITAFAEDAGEERAKLTATGDLAKQIDIFVRQRSSDVTIEKNGALSYEVASLTYATSTVRLSDVRYQIHREPERVYVLAAVERSTVARTQAALRDQAKTSAIECIASAESVTSKLRCRSLVVSAHEHAWIAQAFGEPPAPELSEMFERLESSIERHPPASLGEAADLLAAELSDQGLRGRWTVAPLSFGTTPFSSRFGRDLGSEIERAVAKLADPAREAVVLRGTYTERDDHLRVSISARDGDTGVLLASAATDIPMSSIEGIEHRPQNLEEALVDQRLLAAGESVSGKLRVEVWTNKGDRNLVYGVGEKVAIFLRVNRPAYVQLIYLLANGAKVPLEQAYYLDASKVNLAVEYPAAFKVAAPFGAEQLYAIAHTEKPPPLPLVRRTFDGQVYEVVSGTDTLIRHRGLVRTDDGPEIAESSVALTTTP